ncbi:MAG: dTDP-4-dehydrorhamnose 3,5-epimerase [Rhodobacterales bacterium]|jgi:dTDP-4-dehydrorhamnose 3,5-epimerase|nr:dTDP-4-dehydrorhamnose 3,5-epimerase [Rhodobacterales bacterium]
MIFTPTLLEGKSFIIDIEQFEDVRGVFARTVCKDEFEQHGLNADFVQQSISYNPKVGTLRGMHYQAAPFAEEKLVRVTRGAIFDVIVDIRPDSKTYKKWFGVELSESNRRQIYIPIGFAHGFQTLKPNTEVLYEMTSRYHPDASIGFSWNDPSINIEWPEIKNRMVGIRDAEFPNLSD